MRIQSINVGNNQKSQPNFGAYFKKNDVFAELWAASIPMLLENKPLLDVFTHACPDHELEIIKNSILVNHYQIFNKDTGASVFVKSKGLEDDLKRIIIMVRDQYLNNSLGLWGFRNQDVTKIFKQLTTKQEKLPKP